MVLLVPFALAVIAAAPPQAPAAPLAKTACVALVLPSVQGVEGDAATVAASIRSSFEAYLSGPSLRSVPLDARLPSQAAEEARQKDCPAILSVTMIRKAHGGGGGSTISAIASAAGTTAAYIPLPNYGTAVAVGAARGGAQAIESMARGTRAKDQVTLSYELTTPDGVAILAPKTARAKAKSDGEDLLTPMVEKASEAVATAVAKR
jgi:hypothetical protein